MKHEDKLELLSGIDERIVDRNTKKRGELWYRTMADRPARGGRGKNVAIILLAATLALTLVVFAAFVILSRPDAPTPPPVGEGIVSIERTGVSGDTATYTITYGDGHTATLTVTDRAPDGSGAKVTGLSFDENNDIYLSLATGKLLNMGAAVGVSDQRDDTLWAGGIQTLSLTAPALVPLGNRDEAPVIEGVTVDEEENMSYRLTNDRHVALGRVHEKHEDSEGASLSMARINESGELLLGFASGEVINLGRVVGKDGKDGVGIEGITLTEEGELSVSLTNGTVLNLGNIKGRDGIGIAESKITDEGELVLTYTDGNSVNLGRVVGEKGEDGVGIASINITESGELTIVLTDGTNLNLGVIKGEDGKSAYELYKEKYGYEGTEEEWLFDLVNGKLAAKIKYPVTFDSAGGSEVPMQEVVDGGKITEPKNPTRPGYTFDGWYYGKTPWEFAGYTVTEEMTLKARWSTVTYQITYKDLYHNVTVTPASYTVEDEIVIDKKLSYYCQTYHVNGHSVLRGRRFVGWRLGKDGEPTETLVIPKGTTGKLTVYACWEEQADFALECWPTGGYDFGASPEILQIMGSEGKDVLAVCDGTITQVSVQGTGASVLIVPDYDQSKSFCVRYDSIVDLPAEVQKGAHVSAGDVIGHVPDVMPVIGLSATFKGQQVDIRRFFTEEALAQLEEAPAFDLYNVWTYVDLTADRIIYSHATEITPANGYVRLTVTGDNHGDPYMGLKTPESSKTPQYLLIKYRTTSECKGECFIGSESGPTGQGDQWNWDWNSDGEWGTIVIDLTSVEALTEGLGYFRLDYLAGPDEGEVFDLSYVALFETAEGAEAFRKAFP